jgi:hypothetical protein
LPLPPPPSFMPPPARGTHAPKFHGGGVPTPGPPAQDGAEDNRSKNAKKVGGRTHTGM